MLVSPHTRSLRRRWFANVPRAPAFLLLALAFPLTLAQENEDCLMCHADPELTGTRDGREASMHVDGEAFSRSVHTELDCVMCHQDVADAEFPHDEELAPVDCSLCHDDATAAHQRGLHAQVASCASCHRTHEIRAGRADCSSCHRKQSRQHQRSLHGQAAARGDPLAPSCATCHGGHDIQSHLQAGSPTEVMNIPLLCGRCHHEGSPVSLTHDIPKDRILENYSQSIHGEGLFEKGLIVTAVCTSCHTSHDILPHTDPRSSIHVRNVAQTCTRCHSQIERVHRKVIEGRLWEEAPHMIPACVDCHSPHKIRRVFYPEGMSNQDCLSCHADPELKVTRDGVELSLFVDRAALLKSEHGGTACAQCHTEVQTSRTRACETIQTPVDCSICHAQPVADYQVSTHGTLHAQLDPDAPGCLDCHDKHATQGKDDDTSPTFKDNVPTLCGRCHRAGEKAAVRIDSAVTDLVGSYEDSIHGKGLIESGLVVTATCADCHTSHRELPPEDPRSSVHPANLADTCGSCHHGIEEVFRTSIHWPANVESEKELPTCEDCHTSHTISRTDQRDFRFRMMDQCGRCHEQEASTFFETFHGKVSRLGGEGAAKCYDCHGTHLILPTSDTRSTLSFRNIVNTCARCHTGAHRQFAGYLTHATHHDRTRYPILFWTFWGMTGLLVGTLTFGLLHTLAWLFRLSLSRGEWQRHRVVEGEKLYRRFNRLQRAMHLWMLLSFFTLAITGMALKFSYAVWAQRIAAALGGFETTGVLHRGGAIVLFTIFAVHLVNVWMRKRRDGRSWWNVITGPDSLVFNLRDAREFVGSIRWFLGRGPRPRYGRYTYWEKFDYFAVFWGIAVIGSTGLMLWFPELFTYVLPGWAINVATIVHSDEALLAVAFIFTVHFFNTHFRPDKFPMDPVIFTGRVPLEELKQDKPREYEELLASGKLEQYLVDPFPRPVERWIKAFGFLALGVGLLLILLILVTMLFGYR